MDYQNKYRFQYFENKRAAFVLNRQDKKQFIERIQMMFLSELKLFLKLCMPVSILFSISCHDSSTNPAEQVLIPQNGTWQEIESPVKSDLNNVSFISSKIGCANSYGQILKTIDGGDSWQVIKEMDTPPYLWSIQFLDEQIGWAGVSDSFIFKTTDGGDTWIKLSTPERGSQSVYFINEDVGWVGGWSTGIFKTTDGGNNWTKQLDIGKWERIKDIFFIDNSIGWATCQFYWYETGEPGPTIQYGHVLKTVDGGKSWEKSETIADGFITSIQFFDQLNGYLCLDGVYKTHDGGNTWIRTESLACDNIHFANKDYGWIAGINKAGSGLAIGVTNDGGNHWSYLYDVVKDASHELKSIFFFDIYNGWAVGKNGTIMKYYPPDK